MARGTCAFAAALAAVVLTACQSAPPRVSLEEARSTVARLQGIASPPPRTIDDVLVMLGEPQTVPAQTCDAVWQERRKELATARELAQGIGAATTADQAGMTSMAIRDSASRIFRTGHYRDALTLLAQANDALPTTERSVQRSRLSSLRAILHARIGEYPEARSAAREAERYIYQANNSGTIWSKTVRGRLFLALSAASLGISAGDLPAAERGLRDAIALSSWSGSGGVAHVELALVVDLLVRNLVAQGRLVEAEAEARNALRDIRAYSAHSERRLRAGLVATALASTLGEAMRHDEARAVIERAVSLLRQECVLPESVPMLEAQRVQVQLLAAAGRWPEIAALGAEIERALAGNADALERFSAGLPELGLAQVHVGRVVAGLALLRAEVGRTRAGPGSEGAAHLHARMALALGLARGGADQEAGTLLLRLLSELSRSGAGDAAFEEPGARTVHGQRMLRGVAGLLARRYAGGQRTLGTLVIADALFLLTSLSASSSQVQRAIAAAAARAIVPDGDLAELIRAEQRASGQIQVLLDTLNHVALAPHAQTNTVSLEELKREVTELRLARSRLRAEIDRRFPAYASLIRPPHLALADVSRHLRPGEALIVLDPLEDYLLAWALSASGPASFAVSALERGRLAEQVRRVRASLDPGEIAVAGDIPAFDVDTALALYRALLEPVQSGWRDARHLLVVAHGPLGQLPPGLLVTAPLEEGARDGETLFDGYRRVPWLARTHAITTLPAADALVSIDVAAARGSPSRPFVGFGAPRFSSAPSEPSGATTTRSAGAGLAMRAMPRTRSAARAAVADLPELPETARELRSIAASVGGDPSADVFLGESATERQVKSMDLGLRRVVVFATHGLLPGDLDGLEQPALALTPDPDNDGLLRLDEILGLRLRADWVVLSACNTGAGDGEGAEAISGLGRAFFFAGARAMLVSHWPVHSEATEALTTRLFAEQTARAGRARAEALRAASLGLLDEGYFSDVNGRRVFAYAHPLFWAAFSVVGDGR